MMADGKTTKADLRQRLSEESGAQFLLVTSIVKGIALANGASVVATLVQDASTGSAGPGFVYAMLATTFVGAVLTYWATVSGTFYIVRPADFLEVIFPLALAVIEFIEFEVLKPTATLDRAAAWLGAYSLFNFLAAAVVFHVNRKIIATDYEQVDELIEGLKSGLRLDASLAAISGVLGLGAYVLRVLGWLHGYRLNVATAIFLVSLTIGLVNVVLKRRALVKEVWF